VHVLVLTIELPDCLESSSLLRKK